MAHLGLGSELLDFFIRRSMRGLAELDVFLNRVPSGNQHVLFKPHGVPIQTPAALNEMGSRGFLEQLLDRAELANEFVLLPRVDEHSLHTNSRTIKQTVEFTVRIDRPGAENIRVHVEQDHAIWTTAHKILAQRCHDLDIFPAADPFPVRLDGFPLCCDENPAGVFDLLEAMRCSFGECRW